HGNYFRETVDGIGIAVRENEGEGIGSFAAFMDEMDPNTIQLGLEMSETIEGRFLLRPIVGVEPIGNEFLQIIESGTRLPRRAKLRAPPRVFEALTQIAQRLRGDMNSERMNVILFQGAGL